MVDAAVLKPSPYFLWCVYKDLKSVWRVGERFGLAGQTVHRLLTIAGYRLNNCKWSEDEDGKLRNYYQNTPQGLFSVKTIANVLHRSEDAISIRAGRLGLTTRVKSYTAEARAKISESTKKRLATKGHPNSGRHFGSPSQETNRKRSESAKSKFESQRIAGTGIFSEQSRQLKSDLAKARHASGDWAGGHGMYSRGSVGRREDLGIFVRSRWEANIARYLKWLVSIKALHKWEYEVDTFEFSQIKRGSRSYTPDFKLWDTPDSVPYYWEVKGWMDEKSATKLKRMAKYYPEIRVVVIAEQEYRAISKKARFVVPNWEGGRSK